MFTLELTETELATLAQLIDIAVKAGGLANAEAGLNMFKKLQTAQKKEEVTDATES